MAAYLEFWGRHGTKALGTGHWDGFGFGCIAWDLAYDVQYMTLSDVVSM